MNTLEIKRYLERSETTRDVFLNVYALDQLPKEKLPQERWLLVCNCCPANMTGEHWIAMFYENETLEFFDSFGLSPERYDRGKDDRISAFMRAQRPQKGVVFNNERLQSYESDGCGHYCILYGFHRCRGEPFGAIVASLTALTRDTVVKYIVSTLLF